MYTTGEKSVSDDAEVDRGEKPLSAEIASRGLRDTQDVTTLLSALAADLLNGRLGPRRGRVVVQCVRETLHAVEIEFTAMKTTGRKPVPLNSRGGNGER